MYIFISILILICSVFLVLIVLIQNSKGGGLASGFASSNQVLGVRKTTDFLEKFTWGAAGTLIVLCVVITSFIPRGKAEANSEVIENASAPVSTAAPDFGPVVTDETPAATATETPAQEQPTE